jgi:ubiquinone/menaquinone biosynthesis C-methylase UbiE
MHHKSNEDWSLIHDPNASWRKKIVGEISDIFIIPRYVKFFKSKFENDRGLSFFEIGSGNGDISTAILSSNKGEIGSYTVSEYFPEGVEWLKKRGFDAVVADAENLPLADSSVDVSLEFDVMHHVNNQRMMAREMMRVARGRCLLTESNGLSIFRRLKELTPAHRAAGEKSFTPSRWRSFFENHEGYELTRFEIFPFLFPFKVPSIFLGALLWWNRAVEKIPFIRWQCSSVAIYITYKKTNSNP